MHSLGEPFRVAWVVEVGDGLVFAVALREMIGSTRPGGRQIVE